MSGDLGTEYYLWTFYLKGIIMFLLCMLHMYDFYFRMNQNTLISMSAVEAQHCSIEWNK